MNNQQHTFQNDVWNQWTDKSQNIEFKSQVGSIGDGENKLGAEFDVLPLGQNFSYDLFINQEKWEVKKLDSDNSFRLGVEVSRHYTPIISTVIRMLEKIEIINDNLLDSETKNRFSQIKEELYSRSGSSNTLLLDGLRKNEVSASNLDKANSIIESLKTFKINQDYTIKLYNSITGQICEYNLLESFIKLSVEQISIDEKVRILGSIDNYNILLILSELKNDLQLFDNTTLKELLNKIVRNIFSEDIKLVLVHEDYGFKPLTNLNAIYCNRITSGLPRCKIV
ncbi:MAG: hypothetical protein PHC38_10350 [Weeksellaceae bacterium]|nr:hypothetical protein [Weeksellaceae bacterium]